MSIPRCLQVSLLLLPLGPLLFGCGDGGVEPPTVATVEVSPGTQALTAIGATHQFSAVARDASGNPIAGQTFTWASSATSVATVSATGLVTAVENGTATITATVAGVSGSAALTVSQVVATVEVSGSGHARRDWSVGAVRCCGQGREWQYDRWTDVHVGFFSDERSNSERHRTRDCR
jgi:hypothetical protein